MPRRDAVDALKELAPHNAAAVPALLTALKDKDAGIRNTAVVALMGARGRDEKEVAAAVAPLIDDADTTIRLNAINTLRDCGAVSVPKLVGLLQHKDPIIRLQAVTALGEMKQQAKESVPALVALAMEPADRLAAAHALQQIAPGRSTGLLLEMLQGDKTVNAALRRADKTGKDAAKVVAGLVRDLQDKDAAVGRDAAEALAQVVVAMSPAECKILQANKVVRAMEETVARLDMELSSKDTGERRRAAEALVQLRTLQSVVEFRAANSPIGDVPELILQIGRMRGPIETALEKARQDSDRETRRLVRRALRQPDFFGTVFLPPAVVP
jgi:HEAT repeat protein